MEPEARVPEAMRTGGSAHAGSGTVPKAARSPKVNRWINGWLLLAAGALALLPWLRAISSHRDFPGTDSEAVRVVSELQPEYRPWFSPMIAPREARVERLLFGVQAALGVAIMAYCLTHLRASRNQRRDHVTHD